MRVLIIDDDEDDRDIFCTAIHELVPSIECREAESCLEGHRILERDKPALPDYIFLDINMPKVDGETCFERIKKDADLTHIPVVMYSTTSNQNEIQRFYDKGAFAFVTKPRDYGLLLRELRSLLKLN
jgi:CheY-like chemotaxis protein